MWDAKKRQRLNIWQRPEKVVSKPIHVRPPRPQLPVGYVLIVAFPKMVRKAHSTLLTIPGIVELYALFGSYDFIAKVQAKDRAAIEAVAARINAIDSIISTRLLAATL